MYGIRIKNLRLENKYTQESLASKLNVSPKTVGSWEREERSPSIETLQEMADIFNTSTDYLLGKSNTKSPSNVKEVDLADDEVIKSFEGKPIPEEDLDLIKQLLRSVRRDK